MSSCMPRPGGMLRGSDDWAESEAESEARPDDVAVAVIRIAERIIAEGWCGDVDRRGLDVNDRWWRCCL